MAKREPFCERESLEDIQFDGAFYKTAIKWAVNNLWRVASWYELDDLIQDAAFVFFKLKARYPRVVDRPHLMALFTISLRNHINGLSEANREYRAAVTCLDPADLQNLAAVEHDGFLDVDTTSLPKEALRLLQAVAMGRITTREGNTREIMGRTEKRLESLVRGFLFGTGATGSRCKF